MRYFESECSKNEKGDLLIKYNINGVTQIMYQVHRHHLKIPKPPLICKYNFDQKDTLES